ncbi:aminotransferase-like domain-containing protein [Actinacidiphila oryziradicis]
MWQPWEPPPTHHPGAALDFRHGTPALAEFPVARWRQSMHDAYGRADFAALGYGPAEGSPTLRTEIAALVRQSRALDASPDHIMVTGGATQALDILVRMLVRPGDVVVIEDPSHTVLRQVFGCSQAAVVTVPVDEEGLRVADIDACVRAQGHNPGQVKLVYVTPSHQFPTGFIMSERQRRGLLEWAYAHGATVLEDDYHNEFTFTADRLPALAAERHRDTVVYVGSFSKTLFPALRIGYAVLPPHLELGVVLAQPGILFPQSAHGGGHIGRPPCPRHPIDQCALVHAQVTGHLGHRFARLLDDPHRPRAELRIILPPLFRQLTPLKSLPSRYEGILILGWRRGCLRRGTPGRLC